MKTRILVGHKYVIVSVVGRGHTYDCVYSIDHAASIFKNNVKIHGSWPSELLRAICLKVEPAITDYLGKMQKLDHLSRESTAARVDLRRNFRELTRGLRGKNNGLC